MFENYDILNLQSVTRDQLVSLKTLRNIQSEVEKLEYQFDPNDAGSVDQWTRDSKLKDSITIYQPYQGSSGDSLIEKEFILGFMTPLKHSITIYHPYQANSGDSSIEKEFILGIMAPFQQDAFIRYGSNFVCIDGTHNTTHYKFHLFTLVTCDAWRNGNVLEYLK